MEKNKNLNLKQKREDFKNASFALNLIFILTAIRVLLIWDPLGLIDVVLVGVMAYFVYFKGSKKALFFACAYYLLDSILVLIDNPASISIAGYFMRTAITYFLLRGALSKHQITKASTLPLLPAVK